MPDWVSDMLIIPTYLAQSSIHGLGVYAKNAVKAGEIVSRFMPPLDVEFPPEFLPTLSQAERDYIKNFAYLSKFCGLYTLVGDHDRYMNHSNNPNVAMNPDGSTTNIATRDIAAGEELTCDYETFDLDWKIKLGIA